MQHETLFSFFFFYFPFLTFFWGLKKVNAMQSWAGQYVCGGTSETFQRYVPITLGDSTHEYVLQNTHLCYPQ